MRVSTAKTVVLASLAVAMVVLMTACGAKSAKEAGLQAADLPKDLKSCTQSGPIASFAQMKDNKQYADAKAMGVQEDYAALYATSDIECAQAAANGSTSRPRASMLLLKFAEDSTAASAYDRGLLTGGRLQQVSTQLGVAATKPAELGDQVEAMTYNKIFTAAFHKGRFYILYISMGLGDSENQKALKAVYDRM